MNPEKSLKKNWCPHISYILGKSQLIYFTGYDSKSYINKYVLETPNKGYRLINSYENFCSICGMPRPNKLGEL